jgi:hypothetical protein
MSYARLLNLAREMRGRIQPIHSELYHTRIVLLKRLWYYQQKGEHYTDEYVSRLIWRIDRLEKEIAAQKYRISHREAAKVLYYE